MPDDDVRVPKHHYDALIGAANQLVTVANNAVATILEGTPYESMLRGPAAALDEALNQVPGADTWDGSWSETDVEFETFRHDAQPRNMPDIGVKAIHKPTMLAVESYVKHSVEANQAVALKGLKARVERYGRQSGLL